MWPSFSVTVGIALTLWSTCHRLAMTRHWTVTDSGLSSNPGSHEIFSVGIYGVYAVKLIFQISKTRLTWPSILICTLF